jgi:ABC-type phosphate transport system permease subunit
MLVTTGDRLVKPRKQRQLAAALGASVVELPGDHLVSLAQPDAFAGATVELIGRVAGEAAALQRSVDAAAGV